MVITMKRWRYAILPIAILALVAALIYSGRIQLNRPSVQAYPVRGVDVSHYQGSVDWNAIQTQGIMFAYIKATEGSSHVDSAFQTNWEHVAQTDLRAGAYHFFSFESPGLKQAENFIGTVSRIDHMLPPVVDVEPYGAFKSIRDIPDASTELRAWINRVEAEYGMKPIIYTTEAFYKDCISVEFNGCDIWIRSVYRSPADSIHWKFWQYSNLMRLKGYDGEERYIDMNVFNGSVEDFYLYAN